MVHKTGECCAIFIKVFFLNFFCFYKIDIKFFRDERRHLFIYFRKNLSLTTIKSVIKVKYPIFYINKIFHCLISVPDPLSDNSSKRIEWFFRPSIITTPLTPLLATSRQLLILGIIPPVIVSFSINCLIEVELISGISFWSLSKTPSTSLMIINLLASIFFAIDPAAVSAFILYV